MAARACPASAKGNSQAKQSLFRSPCPANWLKRTLSRTSAASSMLKSIPFSRHRRNESAPKCPYFGRCGGCSYQHGDYAHQVEIKKQILREALERAHLPGLPDIAGVSRQPWNYRNRIRLQVQTSPFALGYRERQSNKLVAVENCPIAAPWLEKAIAVITERGASLRLAAFCDEIEFFAADEGSLLLSFFADKRDRLGESKFAEICAALKENLPELKGAALFLTQPKQTARLLQSWGEGVAGLQGGGLWISSESWLLLSGEPLSHRYAG